MKNILITGLTLLPLLGCNSSGTEKLVNTSAHSSASLISILPKEEKQKYYAQIEDILDHSLLRTNFNGGILIAKDGNIVYEKYFGFQTPHSKDSITAATSFQIASTSKTLTSAAVLKLAQEGKLSIDDPVTKYFPNFPYQGVTVKTLLDHRSGLPNYLNYMDRNSGWDRKQLATNQDVLNTLINWMPPKTNNPDKHFSYCNTNYVLLALIIEKVSGMSYPDYMKQNIFDPLGMNHTFVHTINDTRSVLQSYQPNGALWAMDFSDGPYGDKNIYSTPEDLLKWDQALYEGKILNKEMTDAAFTPYSNEKAGIHNYGLGWRMLLMPSKKVIYHNGHWHGFNSAFARLVDEKATIIILTNRYNPSVYSTAKKLYDVFGTYDGKQSTEEEDNSSETVQDPTEQKVITHPVARKHHGSKSVVKKHRTRGHQVTHKKGSTSKHKKSKRH